MEKKLRVGEVVEVSQGLYQLPAVVKKVDNPGGFVLVDLQGPTGTALKRIDRKEQKVTPVAPTK